MSNLPRFWFYVLALIVGVVLGSAALSYKPDGRINLQWVWLLWAGLPFVGTLFAIFAMLRQATQPGLLVILDYFRWRGSANNVWQLWFWVHSFWLLSGIGIAVTFLLLLFFTDLAFGWSSTLMNDPLWLKSLTDAISWPWRSLWPQATPSEALIEQSRFVRIDPTHNQSEQAGDWWAFLMASLLVYNLLPRALLLLYCGYRNRAHASSAYVDLVNSPVLPVESNATLRPNQDLQLRIEDASQWHHSMHVYWEVTEVQSSSQQDQLIMGGDDWQREQLAWQALLIKKPAKICWHVESHRTPLAELADRIEEANSIGIVQALWVSKHGYPVADMHLKSWQQFAKKYQLVWIQEGE